MGDTANDDLKQLEVRIFDALNRRFPYFFIVINTALQLDYVSQGSAALIGFDTDELLGSTVDELVHPDDLATAVPMALEMMATGDESLSNPSAAHSVEIPIRIVTKSNGYLAMTLSGRVLDESGRILCVLRPNAERYALDNVLRKLSHGAGLTSLLDAVVELLLSQFSVDAAWVVTPESGVLTTAAHRPIPTDSPYSLVDGIESSIEVVDTERGDELWVVPIVAGASRQVYGGLILPAARNNGPSPYDSHILRRTADLAGLAFARARFDRILESAANTDHLTGTLNRRAVERHISGLDQGSSLPSAVLFADLDGFKAINDSWGHAVGDDVLKTVAARIAANLRPDDVLGRLGGDEFVAVCSSLSPSAVEAVRHRIEFSVSQPMNISGVELVLSASVGVAIAERPEELCGILLRSDADMYERKAGRPDRNPLIQV